MKKGIVIVLVLLSTYLFGQTEKKVNVVDLLQDLQIWKDENGKMTGTFWIPQSYWRISLEGKAEITEEGIQQLEEIFKNYVFLCALQVEVLPGGAMNFKSENDIRKEIILIDKNDNIYKPIPNKKLPSDIQDILVKLKPMFSQMLGQMGDGMQFFFFEIQEENENIINEFKDGGFKVFHSGQEFIYQTPLTSLMPPKFCPEDNAEMNGNWKFCPIHGVELP